MRRTTQTSAISDLNTLLHWVSTDDAFCRYLPTGEEADRQLESRDTATTEQVWFRENEAVRTLMAQVPAAVANGALIDAVAEAAFRRAFEASRRHHDLAAQVSDDFRLLAEAACAGYRSTVLADLWRSYVQGGFPTELV